MAVPVVDRLQPVDVHEEENGRAADPSREIEHAGGMLDEAAPIEQSRQLVDHAEPLQAAAAICGA